MPLSKTPSGHLAFSLDQYQELSQQRQDGGIREPPIVLQATNAPRSTKRSVGDGRQQQLQSGEGRLGAFQ